MCIRLYQKKSKQKQGKAQGGGVEDIPFENKPWKS